MCCCEVRAENCEKAGPFCTRPTSSQPRYLIGRLVLARLAKARLIVTTAPQTASPQLLLVNRARPHPSPSLTVASEHEPEAITSGQYSRWLAGCVWLQDHVSSTSTDENVINVLRPYHNVDVDRMNYNYKDHIVVQVRTLPGSAHGSQIFPSNPQIHHLKTPCSAQ